MRLTTRDRRFVQACRDRLGDRFEDATGAVEAEYGRAGVARPGGESRVSMYVVHHLAAGAKPGAWDWRRVWDYHTKSKGWATGGYNATVDQSGRVVLVVPPSRMSYGARARWNPVTFHIVALADFSVFDPSPALLESLWAWLCVCDDTLGYHPWRPHGAIRATECPGAKLAPHVVSMAARGALRPRPETYRD